jgi:hypothetical protein
MIFLECIAIREGNSERGARIALLPLFFYCQIITKKRS